MQQLISTIVLVLIAILLLIAPITNTEASNFLANESNVSEHAVTNKITEFNKHVGKYGYLSGVLIKKAGQTVLVMENYVLPLTHVKKTESGVKNPLEVRDEDLGKVVIVRGHFTIDMLYETSILAVVLENE